MATPEENSFIESYHSILQREVVDPRQFESIKQAQEVMERWQQFYNHRRRHDSLKGSRPSKVWQRYEQQQPGEQQEPYGGDEALSTNGERRSSINCREPFVDKIVSEQMSTNFECQRARNAQTVPQNPSSLYGVGTLTGASTCCSSMSLIRLELLTIMFSIPHIFFPGFPPVSRATFNNFSRNRSEVRL